MDPISAVSFAATILQIVEFSWNLVRGSYKIYESATGQSAENAQISAIVEDLKEATKTLQSDVKADSPHREPLKKLASDCATASNELSDVLKDLERKEGNKVWRSLEAKWKTMRKEKKLADIEQRLSSFRLELLLRLNFIISEEQASCQSRLDEIGEKGLQISPGSLKELKDIQQITVELGQKLVKTLADSHVGRDESMTEIRSGISTLLSKMDAIPKTTSPQNEILKRLYFPSIHAREDVIADTEFGTFDWLLETETQNPGSSMLEENGNYSSPDDETWMLHRFGRVEREDQLRHQTRQSFFAWLETGNQVYHISGKAGAGKSTLMKFLCQDSRLQKELKRWAGDKKLVFASFFFWNSGEKEQKSLEGLCRSLLFETLTQCPELIKEVFPRHWTGDERGTTNWSGIPFRISELNDAMGLIARMHTFPNHRFCFFIDGLDEFEADLNTDHWQLAQYLKKWALSPDIKICVSSRPHEEFLQGFDPKLRMHLHQLTRSDIRRFIYGTLEKEPNYIKAGKSSKEELSNMIETKKDISLSNLVSQVIDRADGVFLWIRLVVRALTNGIRHRDSARTLQKKIENLPSGLEALFDQMLRCVDPMDQERSDKMLLLAANKASQHEPINALLYSWLDDLEDPGFPYNAPISAYSDAEITSRHEIVRCQLSSLSKGLLEMRPKYTQYSTERHEDIYYTEGVDFFHRTVHDYLNDPERLKVIERRLGQRFDAIEAVQRLLFAEFKFARTTKEYLQPRTFSHTPLGSSFVSFWANCRYQETPSTRYNPSVLHEFERVFEHHKRAQYSHPTEKGDNPGIIEWGNLHGPVERDATGEVQQFSYVHWIAYCGHREYIMGRLQAERNLITSHDGLSLLVSVLNGCLLSGWPTTLQFVRDLLEAGATPNDAITVKYKSVNPVIAHELDQPQGVHCKQSTTVWMVFLFMLASVLHDQSASETSEIAVSNSFLVLEEFFKLGVDCDAYFLVQAEKDPNNPEESEDESSGSGVEDALFVSLENKIHFVSLEDLILAHRPRNMDFLMKHILKGKRRWLWQGPKQVITTALSNLLLWQGETDRDETKYRRLQPEDLVSRRRKYVVKTACVRGHRLRRGFSYRLY